MAWVSTQVRYWTVCWWAIFPYPCRKTKTKFCCTGIRKVRCYGFFGENWFCCDGRESHWWSGCWGFGTTIAGNQTVCRNSIPSSSQGCPNAVGDAPPRFFTVSTNLFLGIALGAVVGSSIAGLTQYSFENTMAGAIGGAVVGAVFGAGTGRLWGVFATLITLALVLWILMTR